LEADIFTDSENEYLRKNNFCRFASVSPNGWPHLVPVGYTLNGNSFLISTEFTTKKLRNVREDPKVALIVDDPARPRKAISVQGEVKILEKGPEFQDALKKIVGQHGEKWGFKEGEQAILEVRVFKKYSWGV